MVAKTLISTESNYYRPGGGSLSDLDKKIADAVKEVGSDPDSIQFSSGQTTSNGGQNYHAVALLIWGENNNG